MAQSQNNTLKFHVAPFITCFLLFAFFILCFTSHLSAITLFDRDWKVYLIPFSHTDVGYTAPVPEVIEQHHSYLDSVLTYIQQTVANEPGSRFKWTVEITWPLESYIENRSAAVIESLMSNVHRGNIEIGAMHFSLQTDLCAPEELVRSLYFSHDLSRQYNLPVRTAMISDTPGFSWSLAQILPQSDIPYLAMAMNSFLCNFFGTTNLPYLFYWQAQNGDRTLVWRNIDPQWAYLEGIITHQVYNDHYSIMQSRITNLLHQLEQDGYAYDAVYINCSTGDNGPPNLQIVNNIQLWNQYHDDAKLYIATPTEFFDYISDNFSDQIPTFYGDAPNWWTWFFAASTAGGFSRSRKAQSLLPVAEKIASIADFLNDSYLYPESELWLAYVNNLLYEDHNLGAIYPGGDEEYWLDKIDWITSAGDVARETIDNALGSICAQIPTGSTVSLGVFNPLAWQRSEVVIIPSDTPQIAGMTGFDILDSANGQPMSLQILSDNAVAFVAKNIPPLGYRVFQIIPNDNPHPTPSGLDGSILENTFYSLEVDQTNGGILRLYDKESTTEITRGNGIFNQYLFNSTYPPSEMQIVSSDSGGVLQRLILRGQAIGSDWYETEIVLYSNQKRIDFLNCFDRLPATTTEGIDFQFHFDIPDAKLDYEIPFGYVRLFDDELSGFRINHYAAQHWLNISSGSDDFSATLAAKNTSIHAHSSGTFDGRLRMIIAFDSPNTAYRSGLGELKADFSLSSSGNGLRPDIATRFAGNFNNPLLSRFIPANQPGTLPDTSYSLLRIDPPSLLLTTLKKPQSGDGYILRLYNPLPEAVDAELTFYDQIIAAYETSMLEVHRQTLTTDGHSVFLIFNNHDIKTIRVILRRTEEPPEVTEFRVRQNYPNPFNIQTTIPYSIPFAARVKISVYNIAGQKVKELFDADQEPDHYEIQWQGENKDGAEISSGIYFYRVEANGPEGQVMAHNGKMVLLK